MSLKPTPDSTTCPECKNEGLTLAVDKTHFHELTFTNGAWSASPSRHTETICSGRGVRVFCPHCGAYFQPPETIQGDPT